MPYNKAPSRVKGLPKHAQSIWVAAFNSAYKQYDGNEEKANATAWAAVKKAGYSKKGEKWIKMTDTFYYINSYELSEGVGLPNQIEIMRTGTWKHPIYKKLEITNNTIENIIENFKNKVRGVDISFDLEHGETSHKTEAVCWVKNLIKKGSSLLAEVDWTEFGKEKIKDKSFKYFSPEFKFSYEDPETGKMYNDVLFGGGLTNRPFIKNMSPIMLSETVQKDVQELLDNNNFMDEVSEEGEENTLNKKLLEVLKLSESATEDQISIAVNKLIEDSKKLSEVEEAKKTLETEKAALETEKATLETKLSEATTEKSTADQKIIALNTAVDALNLKFKEADWKNVYSVALSEGRMTPAMEEKFKKLYMTSPDAAVEIIDTLPKVVKLDDEQGSSKGKNEETNHVRLFDAKVKKYISDNNMKPEDYAAAAIKVGMEDPELFKLMDMERKGLN